MISLDALIVSKSVQDQLHTPRGDVRYCSGHVQALEGCILDPKAINDNCFIRVQSHSYMRFKLIF